MPLLPESALVGSFVSTAERPLLAATRRHSIAQGAALGLQTPRITISPNGALFSVGRRTSLTESRPVGAYDDGVPPTTQGCALGYRMTHLRCWKTIDARATRTIAPHPLLCETVPDDVRMAAWSAHSDDAFVSGYEPFLALLPLFA